MQLEIEVNVKRVGVQHVELPEYQTPGAAGLDLAANIATPLTIHPGARRPIPTGIAIQIPNRNIMGLVFARSGLAARAGINLANGVGVIDSDYIGEIICVLQNNGDQPYTVHPGDRIAQLVFVPLVVAKLRETERLEATERGCGGFGSTGV
ncbi:MAG: dUTP diphosphatase [Firmicutes bacterium]|jgi:dUTP pyrophosphatase|nr:dUTP diphosphatase [Bacillota bacterium]